MVKVLLLLSLTVFATADGTLEVGRMFADVTDMAKEHSGVPDCMKVDRQGNLFAASPGGIYVYSVDGKRLCRIRTKTKGDGW